ncbi:leucine-rich repeat-containing protein 70-like [Limulus polyphemus]|uniref:Leucine-rich repeat-containing protein 70-like n=1 Tax=Limulus polyphemus TaxID=6850 RepID=A0ABM1T996_LIMPO|nr:leucine-rich repeat-containing protein 70-like [Limulus polyphemus]
MRNITMRSAILWINVFLISVTQSVSNCPDICRCDVIQDRKTVTCNQGGMNLIPTQEMDKSIQVLRVTAPPEVPNNLTVGRIFQKFHFLEEIHITHSNIPAIGDSSFWPCQYLMVLNLSYNKITLLHYSNFIGLKNLVTLDLSNNLIYATPSAPFYHLKNLNTLSLAGNRLDGLVPRFFYMLSKLRYLDLSGNTLSEVDPDNFKDLGAVKSLILRKCHLTSLHSLVYQNVPNLEVLDLRDNVFYYIKPFEFQHLKRLRVLRLDNNYLGDIRENTFSGHNLDTLNLSRNNIISIDSCAFCNSSIRHLDASNNRLTLVKKSVFSPLSDSLETLNIGFNKLDHITVANIIDPLEKLQRLSLAGMQLEKLFVTTFSQNRNLRYLDLSKNELECLPSAVLEPLTNLEELDLSNNGLKELQLSTLKIINETSSLQKVRLHSNRWHCSKCNVGSLLACLNSSAFLEKLQNESLVCSEPEHLLGRKLETLYPEELEICPLPVTLSRTLTTHLHIGIVVTIVLFVLFLILLTLACFLTRRHYAVYYTHENVIEEDKTRNGDTRDINSQNYLTPKDLRDKKSKKKDMVMRFI